LVWYNLNVALNASRRLLLKYCFVYAFLREVPGDDEPSWLYQLASRFVDGFAVRGVVPNPGLRFPVNC